MHKSRLMKAKLNTHTHKLEASSHEYFTSHKLTLINLTAPLPAQGPPYWSEKRYSFEFWWDRALVAAFFNIAVFPEFLCFMIFPFLWMWWWCSLGLSPGWRLSDSQNFHHLFSLSYTAMFSTIVKCLKPYFERTNAFRFQKLIIIVYENFEKLSLLSKYMFTSGQINRCFLWQRIFCWRYYNIAYN